MTQKELHEKVALLRDGQVVQIDGDFFRAVKVPENWDDAPCYLCELDSICRGNVFNICCEMETVASHFWMLKLAHQ